jgi:YegS/Rv2252/BmrU family lipid kinase
MSSKIAFIINPKAGVKKKIDLEYFISNNFPKHIPFDLIIWKNKDDFESIKQTILNGAYTIVVACGGDGTVNQVASVVVNTKMALGVLPLGSGNGLARSNAIPMNLLKALKIIAAGQTKKMDAGTINHIPFFCTAGIGFDALIANEFATSTKRGFATYLKTTVKEYFGYNPHKYTITVDGKMVKITAFLITVANAGQWGNNIFIAPHAKLDDGIFHISVLRPFSRFAIPLIAARLLSKKIHTSSKFESFDGKDIEISFNGKLPAHFDGEPLLAEDKISIKMNPLSLNIVC